MVRNVLCVLLLNIFFGCQKSDSEIEIYHSPYIDDIGKLVLFYNSTKIYESDFEGGKNDYGNLPVKLTSFNYVNDKNTLRIVCNQIDTIITLDKKKKIRLLCIHYNNHRLRLGNDVDGDFFPMD